MADRADGADDRQISDSANWISKSQSLSTRRRPKQSSKKHFEAGQHASLASKCFSHTCASAICPTSKQNLDVAARLWHLLSFDNVSYITPPMSDCLARLATGEEDGRRRLFTDSDEVVFEAMRPILINGIGNVITRPDLVDRTVFIEVPIIPKRQRLTKKAFWRRLEQDAPMIMTGLIEVIVEGLRRLPETVVADLPRMADFAQWGVAIENTHWFEGSFMAAYSANIAAGNADILQVDDLGMAIVAMMSKTPSWTGTATQLLERLDGDRNGSRRRLQPLPRNGQRLSIELNRLAPVLRRRGIEVQHHQVPDRHRTRLITLSNEGVE